MFTFNKKKKYFQQKEESVQKAVWDLEFKREKTLMIREEVRTTYDGVAAKLDIVTTRIKGQLKDASQICAVHNPAPGTEKVHKDKGTCVCVYIDGAIPVADIETLYDQKERLTQDKLRYEAQMKQLDLDVHGSKKTNEFPDGLDGIDQQIESLRELVGMVREYLKNL